MGRRKKSSRSLSETEQRAKTLNKSPVYEQREEEDEKLAVVTSEQARYIRSNPRIFSEIFQDNTVGYNIIHKICREGDAELLCDFLKLGRFSCDKFCLETPDLESQYTPLHDAISSGNINCAVKLLENGASLKTPALDGFTPLDIAVWNQFKNGFVPESHNLNVLTWGPNSNYNLGHNHDNTSKLPEKVKRFNRDKFRSSICNVNFGKFHTLFLDKAGFVYACGYGKGGRLGLGHEQTLLEPTIIPELRDIIKISCSNDHSLALSSDGKIYSWGVNTHFALGHADSKISLRPRVIKATTTFSKILTVKAAKYHSVLVASDQIYTFGFNGGQLGHIYSDELHQIVPRSVTRLRHKPGDNLGKIAHVHASAAATLVGFESGAVFICNQYDVRKVANLNRYDTNVVKLNSNQGLMEGFAVKTKKIRVIGGSLARQVSSETNTKSTKPLLISILDTDGLVFCCIPSMFKNVLVYHWNVYSEKFIVTDIALGSSALVLLTANGEVFTCNPYPTLKSDKEIKRDHSLKSWFVGSHKQKEQIQMLRPIPLIRQAGLHNGAKVACNGTGLVKACIVQDRISTLDFRPSVEESSYMTDISALFDNDDIYETDMVVYSESGKQTSVHKAIVANCSGTMQNIIDSAEESEKPYIELSGSDEVVTSMLETIYLMHKLPPFSNKAKCPLRYNGMVDVTRCTTIDRKILSHLADVSLVSEDGTMLACHRCVLAARVEYFRTHFLVNSRWGASSLNQQIPIDANTRTLGDFVYYIYTDRFPQNFTFDSLKLLLKLSDQYLVSRLKSFCEVSLADFITEENIMHVLRTANDYNADSLRDVCLYIIAMNVPYYLEHRTLENIEEEILNLLDKVYKNVVLFHFNKSQHHGYTVKDFLRDFAQFNFCQKKENRKNSTNDPLEKLVGPNLNIVASEENDVRPQEGLTHQVLPSSPTNQCDPPTSPIDVDVIEVSSDAELEITSDDKSRNNNINSNKSKEKLHTNVSTDHDAIFASSKSSWGIQTPTSSNKSLSQIIKEEELQQASKNRVNSPKKPPTKPLISTQTIPLLNCEASTEIMPTSPWGNTSTAPPVVSLKDIMSSENTSPTKDNIRSSSKEGLPSAVGQSLAFSPGKPSNSAQREVSETFDFNADRQVFSLRSIMEDEQMSRAHVTSLKSFSRPLECIQIEEQAIQEIGNLYHVDENFNEFIIVRTVVNMESSVIKPAWGKNGPLNF